MTQVKLNTDAILNSDFNTSFFFSDGAFDRNKMKVLIALVYYHRMEQIRKIEVTIDGNNIAYSAEFDCYFSPSEYEIE